jgi:hypothetical protein
LPIDILKPLVRDAEKRRELEAGPDREALDEALAAAHEAIDAALEPAASDHS